MRTLIELMDIEEENGGEYVVNTPYAFKDTDDEEVINEVSYADFKNDDSATAKQKINNSILEVNKQLRQLEQCISQTMKLKTESGIDSKLFYKNTFGKFNKIQERLNRLSHNIRELSK